MSLVLAAYGKAYIAGLTAFREVFEDETDVHLNPKIGRDWMPKGHRRYVLTPFPSLEPAAGVSGSRSVV